MISTGGLGPTLDDVTKKSIAELFGVDMRHEPRVEEHIKELFGVETYPILNPIRDSHWYLKMPSFYLMFLEPHRECCLRNKTHYSLFYQAYPMK